MCCGKGQTCGVAGKLLLALPPTPHPPKEHRTHPTSSRGSPPLPPPASPPSSSCPSRSVVPLASTTCTNTSGTEGGGESSVRCGLACVLTAGGAAGVDHVHQHVWCGEGGESRVRCVLTRVC